MSFEEKAHPRKRKTETGRWIRTDFEREMQENCQPSEVTQHQCAPCDGKKWREKAIRLFILWRQQITVKQPTPHRFVSLLQFIRLLKIRSRFSKAPGMQQAQAAPIIGFKVVWSELQSILKRSCGCAIAVKFIETKAQPAMAVEVCWVQRNALLKGINRGLKSFLVIVTNAQPEKGVRVLRIQRQRTIEQFDAFVVTTKFYLTIAWLEMSFSILWIDVQRFLEY